MEINLPFINYYPRNDAKFIDPMYVPYQRTNLPISGAALDPLDHPDGRLGCYLSLNTWKKSFNPNMVNPDSLHRNWNQTFLNINPQDPCPGGFTKSEVGIGGDNGQALCYRKKEEEHSSSFYTDKQFRVRNQYPDGIGIDTRKPYTHPLIKDDTPSFQGYSVSPWSGNYVQFHSLKPPPQRQKYNIVPSRYSFLGL